MAKKNKSKNSNNNTNNTIISNDYNNIYILIKAGR